jgi:CheR methyltransferase, SAM binding domain
MFKLGIFKNEQLTPDHLQGFVNSRKFIALDLYNSLDGLPPAEIDEIQERMLRWFRVHNGVLKCTYARRFDDFDRLSVSAISAYFPTSQIIRVHDIGVSDGRTSCDLYDHLNRLYGGRLDFLASDYAPFLYVLKRTHGRNRLIVDDQQHVLQIVTPPFVFIVVGRRERITPYPLNALIRHLVTVLYARPLLEHYKTGSPDIQRTRIEIFGRACRAYMSKQDNFRFDAYDVFSGSTERFDIIRAMNVLNYSYFSEPQLIQAAENIVHSLKEGGLFITGSNDEPGTVVNGGIYGETKGRLQRIDTSGKGSEIDALISAVGSPH